MRYYEVSVRTWVSADFKGLTQDGQLLWLFFLCGPIKTPLPGFYSVGIGACLDHLKWEPKKFEPAFEELMDKGMLIADKSNNVIYLPNWIKYNRPPSNPNVMKSWLSLLENVPDCELKTRYIDQMAELVQHLEKSIRGVFNHWTGIYGISAENIEDMDIDYEV